MQRSLQILVLLLFFVPSCFASLSLNDLTIEEKVGQLLLVHFLGETANDDAQVLIQQFHVGGIIYYNWANSLSSPEQVYRLSHSLQNLTQYNPHPIPLFIAADQEGGIVSRLNKGFTPFPGNGALGSIGDPALAEQSAFVMGLEMSAVGVNMVLAPVVDVHSALHNSTIGIRSLGSSPEMVVKLGRAMLHGYHRAGIMSTLKHFPGQGDVIVDSHEALPVLKKAKELLEREDLFPFTKLAEQADLIMTAHLLVPAIDAVNCATLSPSCLDLMRSDLGFRGVIISDSLIMQGLLNNCSSIDEAAIRAINAGCDLLILGGKDLVGVHDSELSVDDIRRIHATLVNAVRTNIISEHRLNQAVDRILDLKNRYIHPHSLLINSLALINLPEHKQLAEKIASLALKVRIQHSAPLLDKATIGMIAPGVVQENIQASFFPQIANNSTSLFWASSNPSAIEIESAIQLAKRVDTLFVFSYNAWKNTSQQNLINSLIGTGKPLILIPLCSPNDAALFPQAHMVLTPFSPTLPSLQATADYLKPTYSQR